MLGRRLIGETRLMQRPHEERGQTVAGEHATRSIAPVRCPCQTYYHELSLNIAKSGKRMHDTICFRSLAHAGDSDGAATSLMAPIFSSTIRLRVSIRFPDERRERFAKTVKYKVNGVHCERERDVLVLERVRVVKRARTIEYAIRHLLGVAREVERSGRKVIYLNNGDPARFDFQTPAHIRKALARAAEGGYNYYAASEGLEELRDAVAEKERKINSVPIAGRDVIVA